MAFSCVAPVYAAAILPVVAFGSLAVIAAVLVATGVMSSNDADFDGLCNDIYDGLSAASKIGPKITLGVMAGISYLHTSIVEMITAEAVKQGAYTPTTRRTISYIGGAFPYYASVEEAKAAFSPVVTVSPKPGEIQRIPFFSIFSIAVVPMDSKVWMNKAISFSGVCSWEYSDSRFFPLSFGAPFVTGIEGAYHFYFMLQNSLNGIFLREITYSQSDFGSISVRFPWELTDDLPSISSSGVLDRVNAGWLARERAIDGTASLPLSVPADTVAGAAAQTQADAQSGTKTKDVVNDSDVVDDSAASDFVDKGKLSFSLVDFFPFCIPFDIVKGIKLLVAPAKAPVFDIPIKFPYIPEQTIHVDLAQYGGVAVFSRWFLTLAFVIGLAVGTSKVMKW